MKETTQITKITCDSCGKTNEGTYLPNGWLELNLTHPKHICSDCRVVMFKFLSMLGIKHRWASGTVHIYPNEEEL